ncbi:MAG: hypothetical protein LBD08_08695 [Treponema sp.]|jgi:hypothetical protein|nr:hypothetical protein [Treponema sp.]
MYKTKAPCGLPCALLLCVLTACAGLKAPPQPEAPAPAEGPVPQDEIPSAGPQPETGRFDRKRYTLPAALRFVPQAPPALSLSPGVGRLAEDAAAALSKTTQGEITAAFQALYIEGIVQGLPLTGVLGGDLVHGWPVKTPRCWAQNWRGPDPDAGPNSWGIPGLVLALKGVESDAAFIVHGPILDFYGRSGGIGGANGAAGYGAPRSGVYYWNGGAAQRFEFGLIAIDPQGGPSFTPWEQEPPLEAPEFPGMDEWEAAAFQAVWLRESAIHGGPLEADGPPVYFPFTAEFFGGDEAAPMRARGVYLQCFDQGRAVFAGLAAQGIPFAVRVIRSPFLDALVTAEVLPGAEDCPADYAAPDVYRDSITGALLEGMARYGVPLTDALPRRAGGVWREAQRFSRGWIE